MKIYICGPVTGLPALNRPAFEQVAEKLREVGLEPVVPHEHVPCNAEWHEAMKICIARLAVCDGIALLPGWESSQGAIWEVEIAERLGMLVKMFDEWKRN